MTEPNIKYGATETTYVLDDNGSTVTDVRHFHDGESVNTYKKRYSMRYQVKNQKDEQMKYAEFSDLVNQDDTYLDPVFTIEKSKLTPQKGYYYVVFNYTKLYKI